MTADLSSVVREAAEREALRQIPVKPMTLHGGITIDVAKLNRDHFIAGFTECASRLPSEEEIAKAIHALYCQCGGMFKEDVRGSELPVARTVLSLIGEKLSG